MGTTTRPATARRITVTGRVQGVGFRPYVYRLAATHGVTHIGLAGGVFQNRILTEQAAERLKADGFGVHIPADVPINDAGLSAGQVIEYGYGQLPGNPP